MSHTRKKDKSDYSGVTTPIGEQTDKWNNDWKDQYDEMMENQDIVDVDD